MEKKLILEINQMRNLMGLEPLSEIIDSVEKSFRSLNENTINKKLLVEYTIRPKNIKLIFDDIFKSADNISSSTIRKSLIDAFDGDLMKKFSNMVPFTSLRDELSEILGSINLGLGNPQHQKNLLVEIFSDNKISKGVNDSFDDFIEGLDKEIRDFELKDGVSVERFLREKQEDIVSAYELLEKETVGIIDNPSDFNIKNVEDMDEFIADYKNTFGDDLTFLKDSSGDDLLISTMKNTYSPKNIPIKNLDEILDEADIDGDEFKRNLDDLDDAISSNNAAKFKKIIEKIYQLLIDGYSRLFDKLLYKNARIRRENWLQISQDITGYGKDSKLYKYVLKPGVITLNKLFTAFKTVLDANITFVVPIMRKLKDWGLLKKLTNTQFEGLNKFLDMLINALVRFGIYVYSYWPIAFFGWDEDRAEEARGNIAGVETMLGFVYLDPSGTAENFDAVADAISDSPKYMNPEEYEKNKKELDDLQKKWDDGKQRVNDFKNGVELFAQENITKLREKRKKVNDCLKTLGTKRTDFLNDFNAEDKGLVNNEKGESLESLTNTVINNLSANMDITNMISSLDGLLGEFNSALKDSEEEQKAREVVVEETLSLYDQLLKKCEEVKESKNEIKKIVNNPFVDD